MRKSSVSRNSQLLWTHTHTHTDIISVRKPQLLQTTHTDISTHQYLGTCSYYRHQTSSVSRNSVIIDHTHRRHSVQELTVIIDHTQTSSVSRNSQLLQTHADFISVQELAVIDHTQRSSVSRNLVFIVYTQTSSLSRNSQLQTTHTRHQCLGTHSQYRPHTDVISVQELTVSIDRTVHTVSVCLCSRFSVHVCVMMSSM